MPENVTIRWTSDRMKRLESLRDRLRTSNRDIERVDGTPTNDAVVDEALRALEQELDMQEEDAKWEVSFANSKDFLQELADEGRAEYLAGETEDFDAEIKRHAP